MLAAGILAAVMSSLDSQFLCLGTMFTQDIYRRFIRRFRTTHPSGPTADHPDDEPSVWVARSFILAIVAISYVLGIWLNGSSVFKLSIWCFSGFAGLFPLILAALYWRGLSAGGAQAAIVTMAATWGFFFFQSGFGQGVVDSDGIRRPYQLLVPGTEWEILPVVPIIATTTVVMVLVSSLTPKPSTNTLAKYFEHP
jgi:SSS family solute:Na+ symporter